MLWLLLGAGLLFVLFLACAGAGIGGYLLFAGNSKGTPNSQSGSWNLPGLPSTVSPGTLPKGFFAPDAASKLNNNSTEADIIAVIGTPPKHLGPKPIPKDTRTSQDTLEWSDDTQSVHVYLLKGKLAAWISGNKR